jgi:hypothetical protein
MAPMRSVTVAQTFPGSVSEAESRWYETSRWPQWRSECDRVLEVMGAWPQRGSMVVWESGPAGRGRVTERVVDYEVRRGQTVEVEDDSIRGHQTVGFSPQDPGVQVTLSLAYEIKRRSPVTAIIDLLFIRRAMAVSLSTTVSRFGGGLQDVCEGQP